MPPTRRWSICVGRTRKVMRWGSRNGRDTRCESSSDNPPETRCRGRFIFARRTKRKATSRERLMPKSPSPSRRSRKVEATVVRLMTARRQTLAVAESCTGGAIANRVTNVPGASKIFVGGVVAYSNEVKQKFLGVRFETLQRHGAVSEAVARAMAEGAREKFG